MEGLWWRDVVSKSANWSLVAGHVVVLPLSEEANNEVASELSSQDLSEEVDVGHKGGLEDDWDIGGVEELDWEWLSETSHLLAAELELNSESLEIDDDKRHHYGSEQVAQVWSVLSVNGLLNTVQFIWLGKQKVE